MPTGDEGGNYTWGRDRTSCSVSILVESYYSRVHPKRIKVMEQNIYTALLINAWYSAQSLYLAQHGTIEDADKERIFLDVLTQAHRLQAIIGNTAGFKELDKEGIREAVRAMIGLDNRP